MKSNVSADARIVTIRRYGARSRASAIRKMRVRAGLRQADVAAVLGCAVSTVSHAEHDDVRASPSVKLGIRCFLEDYLAGEAAA
jgi:DNA-binding XRE family transcriptional regulator